MKKRPTGRPRLPLVGQRIVRSVCAVLLCFVVYLLRGRQGIPFYSALAVLQCMQPYQNNMRQVAKKRVTGTLIGAVTGLILLLLDLHVLVHLAYGEYLMYLFTALFTGVTLYAAVALRVQNTAYFSCVVFLSITVNHLTDINPYLFVLDRVLDTLIGVVLAMIVNNVHLPRKKHRDTLFVSGIDDTMLRENVPMSAYSKVELNRLIEQGAKFTVSTGRTPATVREILPDIRLELPIIAMDGAVLYDMKENTFPARCTIPARTMEQLHTFLRAQGLHSFCNVIQDDVLLIYYDELANGAQRDIYERLKRSPYRNYIRQPELPCRDVVYLLIHEQTERLTRVYEELLAQPWQQELRMVFEPSRRYPSYSYMKIYQRDATRENMLQQLMARLQMEKVVTFGSIEGKYDVTVRDANKNTMVKQLKQLFEPVVFARRRG